MLTKRHQINYLFQMILYVRRNEETSCLKIVHFVDEEDVVPSELEANAKSMCSSNLHWMIRADFDIQSWTKPSQRSQ